MTDFSKQARWTIAAAALTSIVAMPLAASHAQQPTPPKAPAGQAQGQPQAGPGGAATPGGPIPPPRTQGQDGASSQPVHGPGGPEGAGSGGPKAPDSPHLTAPGSPGAPEPGQYSPYSPVGTHLQQTLDLGRPPMAFEVKLAGQTSVLHVGLGDSFSLTDAGIGAGKTLLEALEGKPLETEARPAERIPEDVKSARGNPTEGKGTLTPANPTSTKPGEVKPETPAAGAKPAADYTGGLNRGPSTLDLEKLKEAKKLYEHIIPLENFGGEYTALLWFVDYLQADDATKRKLLSDPFVREYFDMFASDDWKGLKEFLIRKYHLREIGDEWSKDGFRRKAELAHTLIFNNPNRESWEKTSKLMDLLKIRPGMSVADVGSGAGYYTFKVSERVGAAGKVYAIEMEEDRITYVNKVAQKLGIGNIVSVLNDGQTLALGENKVDMVLMVSLYHNIYAMTTARERNTLIEDIRKSMKPDGRLVIVDNAVVPPGTVPYHGPYVAKELVVAQLVNFGFKLIDMQQYIPQRYILVFQLDDSAVSPEAVEAAKKAAALPVDFAKPVQLSPATAPADAAAKK